jgi:hypothetical protein
VEQPTGDQKLGRTLPRRYARIAAFLWAEDIHPNKPCGVVHKMRTENKLA